MIRNPAVWFSVCVLTWAIFTQAARAAIPFSEPGHSATYAIGEHRQDATSVVERLRVTTGPPETWHGAEGQWLQLEAFKKSGARFSVWMLVEGMPSDPASRVLRYVLQEGDAPPAEYRHALTHEAVLPGSGAWPYLLPQPIISLETMPGSIEYLGHTYQRGEVEQALPTLPVGATVHLLRPDVLTGVPQNTREKDETRRYDESDYEYIPLNEADFAAMIEAGLNCFRANTEDVARFEKAGVFYWGGGGELPYPESLYRPLYIGPALFYDEPAVHVRDSVLRPRLREDEAFRRNISPQLAMAELEKLFADTVVNGTPTQFMKQLARRADVDLGSMKFIQPNVYSWETMVSSAAYQLLYHPETPNAIVFEPPGRVGTRRTVPAFNMSYGCQIPVTGSDHFIDIIIGYLRGAARVSGKEWGISTYGGVDRTEAGAFISRAYELGATRFFYWNNAMLACVPFNEVLGHTRHLTRLATEYPHRDLQRLLHAGEVAILLPPGYNLGHVHMGKGLLWGVSELNLERQNREGVSYRTVMGNFFTEIERCLRHGIAFDLLWDLPQVKIEEQGYREVVRIREDGKVEVASGGETTTLDGPRTPDRPGGKAPELDLNVANPGGAAPCTLEVSASVREGDAPVYYAPLPDDSGVHHKYQVQWDLYGPNEEDYAGRAPEIMAEPATAPGPGEFNAKATLHIQKSGHYRLRAATTDLAGRTTVVWKEFNVQ